MIIHRKCTFTNYLGHTFIEGLDANRNTSNGVNNVKYFHNSIFQFFFLGHFPLLLLASQGRWKQVNLCPLPLQSPYCFISYNFLEWKKVIPSSMKVKFRQNHLKQLKQLYPAWKYYSLLVFFERNFDANSPFCWLQRLNGDIFW